MDMWSLGCILAELLSMQKESFPTSQERNALFPGKSCFPLSAEKPSSYSDALDQLNVIFDVIGTPSREDIEELVRWGLFFFMVFVRVGWRRPTFAGGLRCCCLGAVRRRLVCLQLRTQSLALRGLCREGCCCVV